MSKEDLKNKMNSKNLMYKYAGIQILLNIDDVYVQTRFLNIKKCKL